MAEEKKGFQRIVVVSQTDEWRIDKCPYSAAKIVFPDEVTDTQVDEQIFLARQTYLNFVVFGPMLVVERFAFALMTYVPSFVALGFEKPGQYEVVYPKFESYYRMKLCEE